MTATLGDFFGESEGRFRVLESAGYLPNGFNRHVFQQNLYRRLTMPHSSYISRVLVWRNASANALIIQVAN